MKKIAAKMIMSMGKSLVELFVGKKHKLSFFSIQIYQNYKIWFPKWFYKNIIQELFIALKCF